MNNEQLFIDVEHSVIIAFNNCLLFIVLLYAKQPSNVIQKIVTVHTILK